MKKKRQLTDRMNGPDQEFFVWKDMKVLRRRCIIREYDFKRVRGEALSTCYGYTLYDRAEFTPLSKETIEQEYLMSVLKGKEFPPFKDVKYPTSLMYALKDYLYNQRYFGWNTWFDDDHYLVIQPRKNVTPSRLGWGVFEKDIESNR